VPQTDYPWRPLGRLLVEEGLVTEADLDAALVEQQLTGRRLGEVLVARGAITGPELTRALAAQCGIDVTLAPVFEVRQADPEESDLEPWKPLGRLLVERGALTEAELAEALREQQTSDRRLGEILVARGFVTTLELVSAVIDQHGLERTTDTRDFSDASLSSRAREVYEVEGEDEPGQASVLYRTGGFLDATDFAFELLEGGKHLWLRIFRLRNGEREEVWAYDESRAAEAAASPNVVELYGFDPSRWTGPPSYPAA